ncbi:O-antigen polymerase [Leifsonia sp. PS1209]|uniref:O-antigen polymerase n=1 Tax=Leifsonia sp. PS1209 TaxID=2724914 RepID=UPI001442CB76|nr:O-antigen polymerase [Leifsonia sp. PS1209]QIZ99236.1 oligosaccharide repeat unit polymerase [Leifsonia sp. PS1209]
MNSIEVLLLACAGTLFTVSLVRKGAPAISIALAVMTGSLAAHIIAPLSLEPMSVQSAVIVFFSLVALSAPTWLPARKPAREKAGHGDSGVAFARLVLLAVVLLSATLIGFHAFTSSVAAATGTGFNSLSLVEVRAAQNGAARGGGLLVLLGSLGTVLGCVGVYGALRFSRFWLILPAVSLAVVLQNPSRSNSISLIVVLAVFYLQVRSSVPPRRGTRGSLSRRSQWMRAALFSTLVTVGAISVFNVVGSELGKNEMASTLFPDYSWPAWSLSPIYYVAGGFSALSEAMRLGTSPFAPGSSFFSILRVFNAVGGPPPPETIAAYVYIPTPFNLYTGPGQLFFDSGIFGTIVAMLALGILLTYAHRRAQAGYTEWAWVSSVLFTVALSLPQSFTLFRLDLDFEILVGFCVFLAIRRSAVRSTAPAVRLRDRL